MISLCFSTRKINQNFLSHLKEQSFYDNEILYKENDEGIGLTVVYNDFLKQTINDIVIFIHDDIILPKNFDLDIVNKFNNSNFGILGIAGTNELTNGKWWSQKHLMVGSLYHENDDKRYLTTYSKKRDDIREVLLIDGVFMAIDKRKIKSNFNEKISNFHFYDVSFCIDNHLKDVKIGVIHVPQFTHKSVGMVGKQFEIEKENFLKEYGNFLPLTITPQLVINKDVFEKHSEPIAIIIPTKNNYEILKKCIDSIKHFSGHHLINIYVADTGSNDDTLFKYDQIKNVSFFKYDYYHFSKINNHMVLNNIQNEKYLIFCNDDIEFLNDVVGHHMKVYKHNSNVGCIGARLHFPNNKIQHGGINLLYNKLNNQIYVRHQGYGTYHNSLVEGNEKVIGNTAALMCIEKKMFNKVGRFNEQTKECFEDLLLNLELIKINKKNILCANSVAYHHESLSRKKDKNKQKKENHDYLTLVIPEIQKNYSSYKNFITYV